MRIQWFENPEITAVTDHDRPERCIVTWYGGRDAGVQCHGWIEGGKLFVPSDGDGIRESDFEENGLPSSDAHWYECGTGKPAIHGVPGAVLAVFE